MGPGRSDGVRLRVDRVQSPFRLFAESAANPAESRAPRRFPCAFVGDTDALVFACITALNTVAFVIQYRYAEPAIRRTVGELALFSASMMFAGLPLNWSALNREEHIVGAAVLYCILLALRLPDF